MLKATLICADCLLSAIRLCKLVSPPFLWFCLPGWSAPEPGIAASNSPIKLGDAHPSWLPAKSSADSTEIPV